MYTEKLDYKLEKFNEENVDALITKLGLNVNNYFFAMTKPSNLSRALIGNIAEFSNRYCIFVFSESEINLIMLSRLDNKKITEIIRFGKNEISSLKLSNVLISYMLNISLDGSNMKFQVFKKFGNFKKVKNSIELFKKIY